MSDRYQGGVIRAVPLAPTSSSASGIWTMEQQAKAAAAGDWPTPPLLVDPYFNQTSMLLGGEPANGLTYSAFSDASTNNFLITPTGTPYGNAFSPYNSTYSNYFDGSTDYLSTSSASITTSDFTVEAWVYLTTYSKYATIFAQGTAGTSGRMSLYVEQTTGKLGVGITTSVVTSSGAVPLNTWTYVAVRRSSNTVTLYIGGSADGTGTISTAVENTGNRIGLSWNAGEEFTGYISNLRVSSVARTITTPSGPYTSDGSTTLLTCQSNRFIDNSANNFTITANGNTAISGFIPFADTDTTTGSGYFDGSGDYLTSPDNSAYNLSADFTVEAWVYLTTISSEYCVFHNHTSDNNGVALTINSGAPRMLAGNGSWFVLTNSSISIKANSWNHVAYTRSGNTWTIWVNGVSGATASNSSTPSYSGGVQIGRFTSSVTLDFPGYISNLRIVKGTAVYTTTFTPPTSPLTAVANTQLLTLQDRAANQNFGFLDTTKQNTITSYGNATQGTFSPFSQADGYWSNYFQSGGDYLQLSNSSSFNFDTYSTVECWVKFNSLSSDTFIAGRENQFWLNYSFTGIGTTSNKIGFSVYDGSNWYTVSSTTTPAVGVWYHVVGVRDNTTLRIYINGTQENTASFSVSPATPSTAFNIGGFSGGYQFNGYLSNLRFVKGSTSGALPYTGNFTPPTSPLTAITGTQLLTCQSNRFVDNSANGFAITLYGNTSVQSFGPFAPTDAYSQSTNGGSGYFDGTGDCLTIPPNPSFAFGTSDMTIECWVYLNSTSGYQTLVDLRASSGFGASAYTLWVDSGTLSFYAGAYSAGSPTIQSGSMTTGQWYHVALTRASGTNRLFLNGVQQTSNTNAWDNTYSASNSLSIGATTIGTSNYLSGYISNVRLINGAAAYTSNFTPPTAPLTATSATALLCNFTNAGVWDSAARNDLETVGKAELVTSTSKFGSGSYYFDGTGDTLQTKASNQDLNFGSGDFTVEGWVKFNTSSQGGIFQMSATAGGFAPNQTNNLALQRESSTAWQVYWNNTYTSTSSMTINQDTWYHFAMVRYNGTSKLYISGTSVLSTSDSTTYSTPYLGVGGIYDSSSYILNGYIDDLRITKGVARYTTNFTPANYPFPVK